MKVNWTMLRNSAVLAGELDDAAMKLNKLNDSFSDQIDKPYDSNGDWSKEINDQINDECTNL